MKGREGIKELTEDLIAWYWRNSTEEMQEGLSKLLRSHGWVHLDDVVEYDGITEKRVWCLEGKSQGICEAPDTGFCEVFQVSCKHRPATIRDLKGRDK
jgi:hypothetical protein